MHTAPRPFAFVLMPFSDAFDDTYKLAILPACEAAGAYAERVDQQLFTGSILERVYNQISKADLIVADMSDRNPNVFYEVGYAHALGRPTVLLTKSAEDIPFDLRHYPHIVYGKSLATLKQELEARVRWHLSQPEAQRAPENSIQLRVCGVPILSRPTVQVPAATESYGFRLKIEIENRVTTTIATQIFQIGLLAPNDFVLASSEDTYPMTPIDLDGGKKLFLSARSFGILPGAWDSITFSPTSNGPLRSGAKFEFTARVFRDSGMEDYPFTVEVAHK